MMELLTVEEAASLLGISKASLRNWEKHGYIKPLHEKKYLEIDVLDLKDRVSRGEIKRLSSRANKISSTNRFVPTEYVNNSESIELLESIIQFINDYNIKPEQALFLLSVNSICRSGDIDRKNIYNAIQFKDSSLFKRASVFDELKSWFRQISKGEIKEDNRFCKFLLETDLPNEIDFLGIIYQSVIHEGKKSKLGSYYTPTSLVSKIVDKDKSYGKVLDPCCGTGQFLIAMAKNIDDPLNIWGADIDSIAVRITRINIMLYYSNMDFKPNIYNINSLLDLNEDGFDFIATNPPWGAKFDKKTLKSLKDRFPEIESSESFSFFLAAAIKKLKSGGEYSFVLPESILYVKNHRDIRSYLLNNSYVKYIESSGKLFKNVFSSVIRLDGEKILNSKDSEVEICNNDSKYRIKQSRFLSNYNKIMDIYCTNEDQAIIDLVYSYPHQTLRNNATWALGIVTGNNSKYVSSIYKDGMEPLYKGKDLDKMKLKPVSSYIEYNPEEYQQCAKTDIYRAKEKLLYKFISNNLVFAYDNNKHLTLNSANILIPQIEGMSVKVIGALLNSSIYGFIFRKKFNAIKILRGDIESLPMPTLSQKQKVDIESLVNDYLNDDVEFSVIDHYILNIFNIDSNKIL